MNGEQGLRRLKPAIVAAWSRRETIGLGLAVVLLGAAGAMSGWVGAIGVVISAVAVSVVLARWSSVEGAVRRLTGAQDISLPSAVALIATRMERGAERGLQLHPVTGVPTREPLADKIAADIASACGPRLLGAIRFADYDRLATFDLEAANDALARFGARLSQAVKADLFIGQIDRDAFALWFHGDREHQQAETEFRAIVYVASQDLDVGGGLLSPTISAAAVNYPQDGEDPAHLFVRLTSALNAAQQGAEPISRITSPPPAETARSRFTLEQDLNRAIDDGQLKMMFQPVVDVAKGRLIGAEALLRWDHPTLGAISPAQFIPIVEASGMSERFGLWVLNTACREARLWRDEGLPDLKVAVNISAKQLGDPDLKAKIERTLHRHRLEAAALELELTETAAMTDAHRTMELFGALRRTGVTLAIDDFGTGYSSLSYLKTLQFDKLKIDREFVTDINERRDSRAICRALVELGRGLDLVVLAEGVETAAEVATLRALGCHIFQGYFFSKPASGEDFRRLANDSAWLNALISSVPPITESLAPA